MLTAWSLVYRWGLWLASIFGLPYHPARLRRNLRAEAVLDAYLPTIEKRVSFRLCDEKFGENPALLAAAILQGNKLAERYFYERYINRVTLIIRQRVREPERARDLAHDTVIVVLVRLRTEPLEDPSRLPGFINSVAINHCIADARRDTRRQTDYNSDMLDDVPDLRDTQSESIERQNISKLVRQLIKEMKNERDRQILTMYYIEELTKEEICSRLPGLTLRHFDRVISRARLRFRMMLEERGLDPDDL